MAYAKVVLGLPIEGPFDYRVPHALSSKVRVGSRVSVSFRNLIKTGYVVGIAKSSQIQRVKDILCVLDDTPSIDKYTLKLTRELADYYCSSWGEAIEAALPDKLRKSCRLPVLNNFNDKLPKQKPKITCVTGFAIKKRYDFYLSRISEVLKNNLSVIVLFSDTPAIMAFRDRVKASLGLEPTVLSRNDPSELQAWLKIRNSEVKLAIGTRSCVFAPFRDLGLIIVDSEQDLSYKQDQAPHYNAVHMALARSGIQKADLILGASFLSLESFYLSQNKNNNYINLSDKSDFPQVILTNEPWRKKNKGPVKILSLYLQNAIANSLALKEKVLILTSKPGFANLAFCQSCGMIFKCPRCSVNLSYSIKNNTLSCRYCNHKLVSPKICPECNSGYIKYSGLGIERVENEIARMFPVAAVKQIGHENESFSWSADIFLANKNIGRHLERSFDLVVVLSIDSELNLVDFRSAEKAANTLSRIMPLAKSKVIIQTRYSRHYVFRAFEGKDLGVFYKRELRERKQLSFPPFRHFTVIKLRGNNEDRVKEQSQRLYEIIKEKCEEHDIKVLSLAPGFPARLRGNFYWELLLSGRRPKEISSFLKIHLKDLPHSGIIVTVDMDPV